MEVGVGEAEAGTGEAETVAEEAAATELELGVDSKGAAKATRAEAAKAAKAAGLAGDGEPVRRSRRAEQQEAPRLASGTRVSRIFYVRGEPPIAFTCPISGWLRLPRLRCDRCHLNRSTQTGTVRCVAGGRQAEAHRRPREEGARRRQSGCQV